MILELLDDDVRGHLVAHAKRDAPRESCGLLVRAEGVLHYFASQNLAPDGGRDRFVLDPSVWADAEDIGAEVLAVVHSHPNYSANPSMCDRAMCERSELPWIIIGLPSGHLVELAPSGWSAPLVGREFSHGVLDCYALVQDFYLRELKVELPSFERTDGWWERGENLYRKGLAEAGFELVNTDRPQPGDGLLMRVMSPNADNHAAVYLGDGLMLHHLYGQLSRLDYWDAPWQRRTTAIVRHRQFAAAAPQLRAGLLQELRS
jgi:proteasome lid subunit RPN8/RPN11